MKIGIDKLSFFAPPTYVEMTELAKERDVDPNKYLIGIGQEKMSVASDDYDIVSLAANAADKILDEADRQEIDMILFATETGVDFSKSAGTWVHELLGIQPFARVVELKQACYSATAGIQLALGHITLHPESKVLVIASDIATYGIETGGEPTQGAGAVAMTISANPKILAIEKESVAYTHNIDDFWRPSYAEYPFVDGKYSNEAYLDALMNSWKQYKNKYEASFSDFEALLFHVPYSKMGLKALEALKEEMNTDDFDRFNKYYKKGIVYNKVVGNIYTGSVYLSLLSLLEQEENLKSGQRIALYSYGSGAVGEFFAGELQENYQEYLLKEYHEELLKNRKKLSISEYEEILSNKIQVDQDGDVQIKLDTNTKNGFIFKGFDAHRRQYGKIEK